MTIARRWQYGALGLVLVSAAAVVGVGMTGNEAVAEEGWEATLKLQLSQEKKCQFERFITVHQLPQGQLDAIEGRVHCYDGRDFDFSRQKSHQKFELRACQPAVC